MCKFVFVIAANREINKEGFSPDISAHLFKNPP